MNNHEFRKYAHDMVDWISDYLENIGDYPVMSQCQPGDIFDKFNEKPPTEPVIFEETFKSFEKNIVPGITHWQSPNFFAYFPASSSYPSLLGEFLTAAIGAQCMIWQTSPAAAELEEKVMDWLRQMLGFPDTFTGVIQDTASTATLCSILTARERFTNFKINLLGFSNEKFTLYCSSEAHSSIEKAVKIAGFGKNSLRKIETDDNFAIRTDLLEKQIVKDIQNGFHPLYVAGAFGTTSSTGVDNIRELGTIARKYDLWFHIDAAFAGTALILPEYRHLIDGIELADSFVFNPHKWMLTNFDCSAYYVKDAEALIKTFEIMPEYLKTNVDSHVNNYRDWGIPLGRRFRALKLWFVIQTYGVSGLQKKIREQIGLANYLFDRMQKAGIYEFLAPLSFSLICFRYKPAGQLPEPEIDKFNERLKNELNASGKVYLTHTKLKNKYTLRIVIGQNLTEKKHVDELFEILSQKISDLDKMKHDFQNHV